MAATNLLYATAVQATSLTAGEAVSWGAKDSKGGARPLSNVLGPPNVTWAICANAPSPTLPKGAVHTQRLTLSGYNPQAAILAADGNKIPYSLDFLHAAVTFSTASASNFAAVDVVLLNKAGAPIATAPLYLADAAANTTITGWVNFTGHNGYNDQQRLVWDDLADCQLAIDVHWSGAAAVGASFWVDAVGMYVSYTVDPPIVPIQPPTAVEGGTASDGVALRVYDRDGERLGTLPWTELSTTIVRNALGAVSASVPRGLIPDGLLDGERYLRISVDGVETPDWYLLDDDGDDDADAGGPMRPVAIGGSSTAAILDWGVIYSWQFVPRNDAFFAAAVANATAAQVAALRQLNLAESALVSAMHTRPASASQITAAQKQLLLARIASVQATNALVKARSNQAHAGSLLNLEQSQGFAGKTPGFMLRTLIDQAQGRGCFPQLAYSFSDDVDSAGRAWPTIYSKTYDVGVTLLKVLTGMGDDGWVDWEMRGFTLDLYVPDTVLALDRSDVVLRLGKGVTQAPRKRSRKSTRSVLLASGGEGAAVELDDEAAIDTWGRREGFEGRSSITDVGTLTAATTVSLARQTSASEAITLVLDPYAMPEEAQALPRPGGFIRYDQRRLSPTQLEPLRLQSVAIDYGETPRVSIELIDLWVDGDVKRARQLDAILNGSSANERVPLPPDAPDKLAPGPVAGLALVSAAFVAPDGTLGAQMTATWAQVTQNADGTVISDLLGYDIEYRQLASMPGTHSFRARVGTMAQWSPVVPGVPIDVRIRAVDRYENGGAWSAWTTIIAGNDVTPPAVPSKPVVDNWLGLLRIQWDGTFTDGAARAPDLAAVEVHASQVDGFDPNENPKATRVATLYASGSAFTDTPYGEIRYVRLVAVDTTGNRSAPSAQASGVTGQVVSADVFDGAIGSAKLADLAVTNAKIDLLAVNTAQVGTIDVGKITAGVVNAQWIMGGRIATADPGPTGIAARVELNSLGIYRWDGAAASPVVAIDDNGALLTGVYKTAAAGRRIEIGAAGTIGEIDFLAPNGNRGYVRGFTDPGGLEAIQIGIGDPTVGAFLDNRINITTGGGFNYRGQNHEFVFGVGVSFFDRDYNNVARLELTGDGLIRIRPKSGASGQLVIWDDNGFPTSSARIQFLTSGGYGGILKASRDASSSRFELKDVIDSGFIYAWGTSFVNQSDERSKTAIRTLPAEETALSGVRATPVRKYRRKAATRPKGAEEHLKISEKDGPEEIGLIAQEAPTQIVHPGTASDGTLGIDQYQMTTYLWRAVQELAEQVETLTKGSTK